VFDVVGRYCVEQQIRLPTLQRIFSAGAPVAPPVLERMTQTIASDGEMHTPYGATEALPVATISASEVLGETAARTRIGQGTCVGRRFAGIEWQIIRIRDEPLARIEDIELLPQGEIGELIVRGPVVTRAYVTRTEANALHKIADGETFWHRMGDVGYLDEQDRFWFCGRKSQRVITSGATLFTEPCEAIFNEHPLVLRSALVGVGPRTKQTPVIVVELFGKIAVEPQTEHEWKGGFFNELRELAKKHSTTRTIENFLIHPKFPVDIRHNAKIFREKLAAWAEKRVENIRNTS
jgi:acyl-CoA synthetase (AMP-forming)/AMP-acid ligase II